MRHAQPFPVRRLARSASIGSINDGDGVKIGYESHPGFWGRGLMTEAVRAAVACGHAHFKLNCMKGWTLPGNDASDRVLVKAGFNSEGTLKEKAWFKGALHDFRVFGRVAAHTLDA
jgi:[ribosomal protein S5]-alanine N-acetyltransferase